MGNCAGKRSGLRSDSTPASTPDSRREPRSTMSKKRVDIPVDLLIEILSRLHSRSLVRLRCVCKSWDLVTQHPQFISRHLQMMANIPNLNLAIRPFFDHYSVHYFGEDWHRLDIMSWGRQGDGSFHVHYVSNSCNGLICAYNLDTIYVTNPSIRKSLKLPKLPHGMHSVAICHDITTGDYKVLCVYYKEDDRSSYDQLGWDIKVVCEGRKFGCAVFTLGSCSWRFVGDLPLAVSVVLRPVIADGYVFWGVIHRDRGSASAISFDIRNETFDTLVHPKGSSLSLSVGDQNVVELGGYFCIYDREFNWSSEECELVLWILMDYNRHEWTKYVIDLHNTRDGSTVAIDVVPLALRGTYILFTGPIRGTERYDFYNLNTKSFEMPLYLTCGDVLPYVESLISPITIHATTEGKRLPIGVTDERKPWWQQDHLEGHGDPNLSFGRGQGYWSQLEGFTQREGVYGKLSRKEVDLHIQTCLRGLTKIKIQIEYSG